VIYLMRRFSFITLALWLISATLAAQTYPRPVPAPTARDFAGTLTFLSSDWMEGREAGTRGSFMAADFIAALMQLNGLEPFGDHGAVNPGLTVIKAGLEPLHQAYFQDFEMKLYYVEQIGSFTLILGKPGSVMVSNVLGIIRGKDSTRNIVVGAHYDHLGNHDGHIYNGADDNASGVSGMLALVKAWVEQGEKPPCNIIFAAWTGEEKGCLGSRYFVKHTHANPDQIVAYINMDMISRSAPEDTAMRQLSIGTMPVSEGLRQIAIAGNLRLLHPFELDLWDVTGHTGSDYSSFITENIPVMTFFSGYQADYHTPEDDADKTDLKKMEDILKLVNDCILKILEGL
jgi:hypothetical protein